MTGRKGSGMPDKAKTASCESRWKFHELDVRRSVLERELLQKGILKNQKEKKNREETTSGITQAIKFSSEFLAAVVVGIILGVGLDQLVGTSPWGLIVFLLLGFVSGVLNVLRSAGFSFIASTQGKSTLHTESNSLNPPDREER